MKLWGNCLILALSITSAHTLWGDDVPFKPKAAESYAAHQTISNVTIGVDTYESPEEAKTAFSKVNPYESGVLPVLVVIENKSKNTIKLDAMQVQYVTPRREKVDPTPARDLAYLKSPRRPEMSPSPIPKRKPKNALASPVLEIRSFTARMLPPGESASGFVYFQTGHEHGSQIYITGLRDAKTDQDLFYYEIPLEH